MRESFPIRFLGPIVLTGVLLLAPTAAWVRADHSQVGGTGALEFDGVNDFVTLGNRSSYQMGGDMSLCAWYRLAAGNAGRKMGIAAKMFWNGDVSYSGYGLFRYDDNDLCFLIGPGRGSGYYYDAIWTDQSHTDTEWHHVAGVIRQGNAYLYLDGVRAGYMNDALKIRDSGQDLLVGKYCSNVDDWYFEGRIDEVYLYSRGLSIAELQAMMVTRPSTADAALVGYWSFDEANGQVVSDRSTRHNDGYLGRLSATDSSDPSRVSNTSPCQNEWSYMLTFNLQSDMARVTSNNNAYNFGGAVPVQRLTGRLPDTAGMLRLQNYPEVVNSHVIPAQAVFTFSDGLCWPNGVGPVNAAVRINISFYYLFGAGSAGLAGFAAEGEPGILPGSTPGTLRVWASTGVDEGFGASVIEPAPPLPGSRTSSSWAYYSETIDLPYNVAAQPPIQVVLELRGPANTAVRINNLSVGTKLMATSPDFRVKPTTVIPPAQCNNRCGDFTDDTLLTQLDYLTAVYGCGIASSSNSPSSVCMEGAYTSDGFTSVEDVEFAVWAATNIWFCSGTYQLVSAAEGPALADTSQIYAAGLNAPLLVAGKAFAYNPDNRMCSYWFDRVFSFDFGRHPTGLPSCRNTQDRLNTRLVKDKGGELYQLNVKDGLVRLSDGRVIQDWRTMSFTDKNGHPTPVHVGWKQQSAWPPIQDAAFDESGNLYVVPVCVNGDPSSRAVARISLGLNPPATSRITKLYGMGDLYDAGVQEIEIDNNQNVCVLDKYNWTNSRFLRYNWDTAAVIHNQPLMTVTDALPTAFHVSRRDGQIFLADSWGGTSSALVVLNPTSFAQIRRISIQGLSYITDLAEYYESDAARTIWAAGFSLPIKAASDDLANNAASEYRPLFKPFLTEIPLSADGPIDAECLYEYREDGQEYLSLPLSLVCTGRDY